MSLEARSIRGVRVTMLASCASILAQVAIVAVLARLLTTEQYGLAAGALVLVRPVQHLLTAGPERAVLLLSGLTPGHLDAALWTLTGIGLAASAALAALAILAGWLGAPALFAEVLAALAPLVALTAPAAVFRGALRRQLAYGRLAVADMAGQLLGAGALAIAAAAAGWGVYALVAGLLGQALLQTMIAGGLALRSGSVHLRWPLPGRSSGPLTAASLSMSRTALLEVLHGQAPAAIIGTMLGAGSLGLYNRAAAVVQPPVEMIVTAITRVRIGAVGARRDDPAARRQLCGDLIEEVAGVALPLCIGAAAAAPDLAATILGPAWDAAAPAIAWFAVATAWAMLGHAVAVVNEGLLRLDERFRIQAAVIVVGAAGLAVGAVGGLEGALTGWAAAWAVFLALHLRLASRALDVPLRSLLARLLPGLTAAVAGAAAVHAIGQLSPASFGPPARLTLDIAACAAAATLIYGIFFPRLFGTLLRYAGLRRSAPNAKG